jgi:hypothetical protein
MVLMSAAILSGPLFAAISADIHYGIPGVNARNTCGAHAVRSDFCASSLPLDLDLWNHCLATNLTVLPVPAAILLSKGGALVAPEMEQESISLLSNVGVYVPIL